MFWVVNWLTILNCIKSFALVQYKHLYNFLFANYSIKTFIHCGFAHKKIFQTDLCVRCVALWNEYRSFSATQLARNNRQWFESQSSSQFNETLMWYNITCLCIPLPKIELEKENTDEAITSLTGSSNGNNSFWQRKLPTQALPLNYGLIMQWKFEQYFV